MKPTIVRQFQNVLNISTVFSLQMTFIYVIYAFSNLYITYFNSINYTLSLLYQSNRISKSDL